MEGLREAFISLFLSLITRGGSQFLFPGFCTMYSGGSGADTIIYTF
jgi:hypothetical protein